MAQTRLPVLQDVQGGHRNDLVKTMRGVFRETPRSRMSVRDIGALEAFSAKAGDQKLRDVTTRPREAVEGLSRTR